MAAPTFYAGDTQTQVGLGGSLLAQLLAAVQTDADTTEKTLTSCVLAANTIDQLGEPSTIRITAAGVWAANANAKTVRVKFDATTVATLTGALDGPWYVDVVIIALSAGALAVQAFRSNCGVTPVATGITVSNGQSGTSAVATISPITIALTGQNGVAAAGDILGTLFLVEYIGGSA